MKPTRQRLLSDDAGYATVTAAGIIAAVLSLFMVVVATAAHVVHTHRAQVAADLTAVSAAYALYRGADACRIAAQTAQANSASLTLCQTDNGDVVVGASVRTGAATARAGPL